MKMKRLLPLLLTAAVIATGCTSDEISSDIVTKESDTSEVVIDTVETNEAMAPAAGPATEEAAHTTEAPSTEEVTAEPSAPEEDKTVFEAGTWTLYEITAIDERIPIGYCFMNDDGMSGENLLFEDGTGYRFEYEIGINEIRVTVDGENVTVPIAGGDPSYVMLDIPDCGRVDMVYFSDATKADIPEFYSNEQLGLMAQEYYAILNDHTPSCIGTSTNADGTVTIHLFDSFEDHNATSAWYTVDRWSTVGTDDIMGDEVNFLHTLLQSE